jgi:hypothetical protein
MIFLNYSSSLKESDSAIELKEILLLFRKNKIILNKF